MDIPTMLESAKASEDTSVFLDSQLQKINRAVRAAKNIRLPETRRSLAYGTIHACIFNIFQVAHDGHFHKQLPPCLEWWDTHKKKLEIAYKKYMANTVHYEDAAKLFGFSVDAPSSTTRGSATGVDRRIQLFVETLIGITIAMNIPRYFNCVGHIKNLFMSILFSNPRLKDLQYAIGSIHNHQAIRLLLEGADVFKGKSNDDKIDLEETFKSTKLHLVINMNSAVAPIWVVY